MLRGEQADHGRSRRGNRTRCDRLLRGDYRDGHGPLWPDTAFMRHFVDHRQERVDDMTRAGGEGEAVGDEGRDDGNLLGIFADDLLRNADEEVDSARHFHRGCGHDNREDDQKYFAWDACRRDIKTNDEHEQAHCPPQPESNAAHPSAHRKRACQDQKFEDQSPIHTV